MRLHNEVDTQGKEVRFKVTEKESASVPGLEAWPQRIAGYLGVKVQAVKFRIHNTLCEGGIKSVKICPDVEAFA